MHQDDCTNGVSGLNQKKDGIETLFDERKEFAELNKALDGLTVNAEYNKQRYKLKFCNGLLLFDITGSIPLTKIKILTVPVLVGALVVVYRTLF